MKNKINYVSRLEAARLLGITPHSLRAYARKGVLTQYTLNGKVYFSIDEINRKITESNAPKMKENTNPKEAV